MLNQLVFLYFEQRFAFEFSFILFLPQKDQKFSVFVLVSDYQSIGIMDDHAGLRREIFTLILRFYLI